MPAKKVWMRRIREILRLEHACGALDRAIARSMGVARSTSIGMGGRVRSKCMADFTSESPADFIGIST